MIRLDSPGQPSRERSETMERVQLHRCLISHIEWGIIISNSLYLIESDASLGSEVIFSAGAQGGISPSQLATASPRHVTTFPAPGRDSMSPLQQRWVKRHSESENPMAEAFSGFSGRFPCGTWNPIAAVWRFRNGVSPVRTWRENV